MIALDQDKQRLQRKASTLVEALPYMKKYNNEIFVVKFGGNAMINDELSRQFAEDIVLLRQVGINPVIIHGGGPQIGEMLGKLGIESSFRDGLRVTSKEAVDVAEMVLCGRIGKSISASISEAGGRGIALSGKDGNLVTADKLMKKGKNGEDIDLGFVGHPVAVDPSSILQAIDAGTIPIISPIAMGEDGHTYNINADTMAGAIASALGARRFILLTDVEGVLNKDGKLLTEITKFDAERLMDDETISGGMVPKIQTCLDAVEAGVKGAVIIDGRLKHAILLEIFTERGVGTLIRL